MRSATRRFLVAAFVGIPIITTAIASDRKDTEKAVRVEERVENEALTVELNDGESSTQVDLVPLPPQVAFKRAAVQLGDAEGTVSSGVEKLVYSNTLGQFVLGPPAGVRIADDITTVAEGNCGLERFLIRVTGDKDNNPNIDEGPYTVHYALYPSCPGAEVCLPFDAICPKPIPGAEGSITLPDEGFYEVELTIPNQVCLGGINNGDACLFDTDCHPTCQGGTNDGQPCSNVLDCPGGGTCNGQLVGSCGTGVSLPSSFYLAITFSRQQAGIVVGAPALTGVTSDRYDSGSFPCASAFGGFPAGPHASFFAEFFVDGSCDDTFPAYRNTLQSGRGFSPGALTLFADDITLGVDGGDCNMVAYEVALKGQQSSSQGAVQVELFTALDNADPEEVNAIPGTRAQKQVFGNDVQILRRTFANPIPLGDYIGNSNRLLWAMFKSTSSLVGPVATCVQSNPGSTLDLYSRYQGTAPNGQWIQSDVGASCHSAFELTIYCEGDAPEGACCDILLREDYACVGGSFPGGACTSDADCPCEPACEDGVCGVFGACEGGPNPGDPCFGSDALCACPSLTCNGNVCDGGANDGQQCVTGDDCGFPEPCNVDGACVGDAVCREIPEVNCATTDPARWVNGESCGPLCIGGQNDGLDCASDTDCPGICIGGDNDGLDCDDDLFCSPGSGFCDEGSCQGSFCFEGVNDGLPCTRQADCPGGSCEDQPFESRRACGLGACCGCEAGACGENATECLSGTQRECFEFTLGGARLYLPGSTCSNVQCPFGACLGREGECTQERKAFCVGGDNDGQECDPFGFLPNECPPGFPTTSCPTVPGCEDPQCCTDVCNTDAFCCNTWWDQTCATTAASLCTELPANDDCSDPDDPVKGALLAELPLFVTEIDLVNSNTSDAEPGFCCLATDPGGPGEGAVWAKVVAEATCQGGDNNGELCRGAADCPGGTCPSTVSIGFSTCQSVPRTIDNVNYPADDSVLQVFRVGNPDLGLCGDLLTACSVSAQDCPDGSVCTVTDNRACNDLIPVACNDDYGDACSNPGPGSQPKNSQVCIPDAIVGETYYAMIAAAPPTTRTCDQGANDGDSCTISDQCDNWCAGGTNARQPCAAATQGTDCPGSFCEIGTCVDDEHRGVYRLTVNSPCGGAIDLIPNDLCGDADPIVGVSASVPFDLSGGVDYDPVTFDCPGPDCLSSLKNDIWYDWVAPATGSVEIDTCGGFGANTPDTSLVVYQGCSCPVEILDELDCSDFETSGDCFAGSRVRFNAVKDQCYKIRLGGRDGATDAVGNLNLNLLQCPRGTVTFDDPLDGTVDARQPHIPTNDTATQGIQDLTVTAPAGVNLVDRLGSQGQFSCWSVCETGLDASLIPNRISNVTDNFNGTWNLRLLRPISPNAVTTITYQSGDGTTDVTAEFISHPGNADGGAAADIADVTALVDYLSGNQAPPWGVYSMDIDHSGMGTPADLLRLIDLLQGAHDYSATLDTLLPAACGSLICCP